MGDTSTATISELFPSRTDTYILSEPIVRAYSTCSTAVEQWSGGHCIVYKYSDNCIVPGFYMENEELKPGCGLKELFEGR